MKHTREAESLADTILKASGSSLRHYTLEATREKILGAAQDGIDEAQKNFLSRLFKIAEFIATANELLDATCLILPMAKGWASVHDLGPNKNFAEIADEAVARFKKALGDVR